MRRTGRIGPWLAVPVIGFAAYQSVSVDAGDDPVGTVLLALGIGIFGYFWADAGAPRMRIGSTALFVRGIIVSERIPLPMVHGVAANEGALIFRTRPAGADAEQDAGHAYSMVYGLEFAPLTAGNPSPAEVVDLIGQAQASAPDGGAVGHRLAWPALIAILWDAAAVAGLWLAR